MKSIFCSAPCGFIVKFYLCVQHYVRWREALFCPSVIVIKSFKLNLHFDFLSLFISFLLLDKYNDKQINNCVTFLVLLV